MPQEGAARRASSAETVCPGVDPDRRRRRIPSAYGRCRQRSGDEVSLADTATVITFTIVHLPIPNSALQPPFVVADLILDGAD